MSIDQRFRKLFFIPLLPVFIINMILLGIIKVLNVIGKSVVYANNKVSDAGDWLYEQATGERSSLESFDDIKRLLKSKKEERY